MQIFAFRHVAHVSFYLPTHFLRRPSTDILKAFPHDVASAPKESAAMPKVALLCRFPESAPNKMKGENPQISHIFASNRDILSAITRNVEGKQWKQIISLYFHQIGRRGS